MSTTTITRLLGNWDAVAEGEKRLIELALARYGRLWVSVIRSTLAPDRRRAVGAEDVLQEVLIELLDKYVCGGRRPSNGTELNRLVCWLAANRAIDAFRRTEHVGGESAFETPGAGRNPGTSGVVDWRERGPVDQARHAEVQAALHHVQEVVSRAELVVRRVVEGYEGPHQAILTRWLTSEESYRSLEASGLLTMHTVRRLVKSVLTHREVQAAVGDVLAALHKLSDAPELICEIDLTWFRRLILRNALADEDHPQ